MYLLGDQDPLTYYHTQKQKMITHSIEAGLQIENVMVTGRHLTHSKEILAALDLPENKAMLLFDPTAAQERVASLPWVKTAQISRQFPNTIQIDLVEHKPIALWQHAGEIHLVDAQGDVIPAEDWQGFHGLPLLVGEHANKKGTQLLASLVDYPELLEEMKSAILVGNRRWDIQLKSDITLKLPQRNPLIAWQQLADYQHLYHLLDAQIVSVDMRLADRLIVKTSPAMLDRVTKPGKQT
jgi:cell division protein FtsQ